MPSLSFSLLVHEARQSRPEQPQKLPPFSTNPHPSPLPKGFTRNLGRELRTRTSSRALGLSKQQDKSLLP